MRAFLLLYFAAIITAIIGWAINLANVIHMAVEGSSLTALFVLKLVGVFLAPLGAILGLFF